MCVLLLAHSRIFSVFSSAPRTPPCPRPPLSVLFDPSGPNPTVWCNSTFAGSGIYESVLYLATRFMMEFCLWVTWVSQWASSRFSLVEKRKWSPWSNRASSCHPCYQRRTQVRSTVNLRFLQSTTAVCRPCFGELG